jgi:ArsR family transcriptional regulator
VRQPSIFNRLNALGDSTRSRILLALERHELTVSELCEVLQLPQSTVSRHLRILSDEGWSAVRADGPHRRYRMEASRLDPAARRLWQLVKDAVIATSAAQHDAARLQGVLARRPARSQEFFATAAGQWDRLRVELFGRQALAIGLLGLLDPAWTVGDLGAGTGQVAAALSPFVARVIAVDRSAAMLQAARRRLSGLTNIEIRTGELETLPLEDRELDAAVLFLVLHLVPEPEVALSEVARALKPGGRLVLVDMKPHDREQYRQEMGHLWLGFAPEQLSEWYAGAGLSPPRLVPLPADPEAKGPTLFAASATRS